MKLVEINKHQLPLFKSFDLFGLMDREKTSRDLMLGAISDREEGNVPAGLLFGRSEKKELQLRWLFVEPFLRGKSYGELLLSKAFQHAVDIGAEKLRVLFPKEYGYESICRNDHAFFRNHGFHETESGDMEAEISDYARLTEEYHGPSFFDESAMLDKLLSLEVEDEDETDGIYDDEGYFQRIHKPWDCRRAGLREFSKLPQLQSFVKKILEGKKALKVGSVGELSFTQFREAMELCESQNHTGYLKSLMDIPVDYFDLDVSAYLMDKERVSGLFLVHHNERKNEVIVELLFTVDGKDPRGFAELLRFGLLAANEKYPADTTLILPDNEKIHRPLFKKLFGE